MAHVAWHISVVSHICRAHISRVHPPKKGEIALWPNTRIVKCKYFVSQKRNEANDKVQWYNILLTFML